MVHDCRYRGVIAGSWKTGRSARVLLWAVTVCLLGCVSVPTIAAEGSAKVAQATGSELGNTSGPAADNKVSLDFLASDIQEVLKALSMQSGVNIIAGSDVKGTVTTSLKDVTLDEALRLITSMTGYKYAYVEGSYAVGTQANLDSLVGVKAPAPSEDERMVSQIVILKHADGDMVAKMFGSIFKSVSVATHILKADSGSASGDGAAAAAPSGNAVQIETVVVLSGPQGDVAAMKALLEETEANLAKRAAGQTMQVYEIKYADPKPIPLLLMQSVPGLRVQFAPGTGFDLQRPSSISTGTGLNYQSKDPNEQKSETKTLTSRYLVLQGTKDEVEKALAVLSKIDIKEAQIMIEAKIVDITDAGAKDIGIDWGNAEGYSVTIPGGTRYSGGTIWPGIDATLNALVTADKAKVLATPNVMALDGHPASVFIGDEVIYITNITSSDNGTTVNTETAEVGIQLQAISTVSPDGYITMNLHPEVSVITNWRTVADLSFPEISKRFVDSTVRVKDGESIVIGGLMRDEEITAMTGIPILKDLPFIGKLFQSRSRSTSHSQVVLMITPKVMKGE